MLSEEYERKIGQIRSQLRVEDIIYGKQLQDLEYVPKDSLILLEGRFNYFPGFATPIVEMPGNVRAIEDPTLYDPLSKKNLTFEPNGDAYVDQPQIYYGRVSLKKPGHTESEIYLDSLEMVNPLFGIKIDSEGQRRRILVESEFDTLKHSPFHQRGFNISVTYAERH